eukprot:3847337-Rhodomonas_salina.2
MPLRDVHDCSRLCCYQLSSTDLGYAATCFPVCGPATTVAWICRTSLLLGHGTPYARPTPCPLWPMPFQPCSYGVRARILQASCLFLSCPLGDCGMSAMVLRDVQYDTVAACRPSYAMSGTDVAYVVVPATTGFSTA